MKLLIFDTETTGKPKNYKASMTDVENWPRIIQLAWEVFDTDLNETVNEVEMLIEPDGWVIPNEKFWIDNNFYTAKNEAEGLKMPIALEMFLKDYNQCDYLVAHNIGFDYPILGAEMIRYKMKGEKRLKQICTMGTTVDLCRIPFPNGGKYFKWPKLIELHQFLFNKGFDGAHDASNDVQACRICLLELIKRSVIKLN